MKKGFALVLCLLLAAAMMTGCANGSGADGGGTESGQEVQTSEAAPGLSGPITVVSREEGSGTRGAFVELMGVETEEGDMTTEEAEIANSTSLVQNTVAGNKAAIGYISLGSYDASAVKAIPVDGVEPTVENLVSGAYAVSRPFVICYREENLTELGRDFVNYILSADGQAILTDNGYIASAEASGEAYTGSGISGSLSLNGSTSVGPVMEKLAEAYMERNTGVTIDIQQTGSGTGITATLDGSCEIGMSSRALKDEEIAGGLTPVTIALDGIAVIVNRENAVDGLSAGQIRQIFTGEITDWSEIG